MARADGGRYHRPDPHSYPHPDGYPYAHRYADANSHTYSHDHSHTNSYTYAYRNTRIDRHAYRHTCFDAKLAIGRGSTVRDRQRHVSRGDRLPAA